MQNWACTRLSASMTKLCCTFSKIFVILLVLSALVAGQRIDSIAKNRLIDLHEDNWQLMLTGEWMVEFFAPWCPACKNLGPTWERFATKAGDLNVHVAKIDVTTSPSLSGRFFVTALPTIYHVIDGEFRQYRGSRDADGLLSFIKHKQWKQVEPLSAWKKPDTIHMSILSYFFKLSHQLKDLNGRLQEEYGLPTWGSYALFAFSTIFVGALLGLLLVCIVDSLYPPKKAARQSFSETKERDIQEGVEDLANDELEDDNVKDSETEENDDDNDEEGEELDNDEEEENEKKESAEQQQQQEIAEKLTKVLKEDASPSEVRKRKPRKD